jgi:hypothetical protein
VALTAFILLIGIAGILYVPGIVLLAIADPAAEKDHDGAPHRGGLPSR